MPLAGGIVIIPRPPVAPLRLAGTTNSQLIVLINKSPLGFPMRPRGQGWNVHRGQLLCIKKRSSQTREPRAARCPAAAARRGPAQPGRACSAPRAEERSRSEEGDEGDAGREGKLPPPPPLHLEYCLPSGPWNVRNNTNINTNFSRCTSGPNAASDGRERERRGNPGPRLRQDEISRREASLVGGRTADCGKCCFFSFHTETDCRRCPRQRDIQIKTTGAKLVDVEMEDYPQSPPPPPPPLPDKPLSPFPCFPAMCSPDVYSAPLLRKEG